MSTIRPFPAIRYNTKATRDIATKLTPPYDILSGDDKQALLRRDARNFVLIDLPHVPPKSAGPAAAYEGARDALSRWLADGTMVRDQQPALYVYHQRYSHAGRQYVRKMFFARLRLEPFGAGSVFPHERTFGGPKEDRLCLTKATAANLSPIFGLYQDADNSVARRLESALAPEPIACGTLDGVENRLWAVMDPTVITDVQRLMQPKPTFIADGHHRYGTALMYRDWLAEQRKLLADDHPANYVLCVFCAMEDPGLLILPTHRVLPKVAVTPELFAHDGRVEVSTLKASSAEEVPRALGRFGPQAVAFCGPDAARFHVVRPTKPDLLKEFEAQRTAPWRALGLAFLHAYLLDRLVAPQLCGGNAPEIHYVKSATEAVQEAHQTHGSAFLMQPTTMEELRAVCQANDLMPQKSTYFYPKLASGLVINPLND